MNIELKEFRPIVEQCGACSRAVEDEELGFKRCSAYINPSYWWIGGRSCPLTAKGVINAADIAKMALKEGLIKSEGGLFLYNNQRIAANVGGVAAFIKRNKPVLEGLKRQLGITDGTGDPEGKVRVGQQKQKKSRRR